MKKLLIKTKGIVVNKSHPYLAGVPRSTLHLLRAIAKQPLNFEIKLYNSGISSYGFDFYNMPFKSRNIAFPDNMFNLELFYRKYFNKHNVFHIPHNRDNIYNNEKFIVTLHDILEYNESNDLRCRRNWEQMVHRSLAIATCSQCSKNEILNSFHVDPEKITVIPWGISREDYYIEDTQTTIKKLKNMDIDYPYFFTTSCSKPRKNVITLLRAFKKFLTYKPRHRLILAWSNPPQSFITEFANEIHDKTVIFLKNINDKELLSLYNGATATFYISKFEGFGFPILESMACGTPVVTCQNSSLPEVGRDAALYVKEENIDEIVDIMRSFEDGNIANDDLIEAGLNNIQNFSWERTAKEYIKFYEKALNN